MPKVLFEGEFVEQGEVDQAVLANFHAGDVALVDPAGNNIDGDAHQLREQFAVHHRDSGQLRHGYRGVKVHVTHLYKPLHVIRN